MICSIRLNNLKILLSIGSLCVGLSLWAQDAAEMDRLKAQYKGNFALNLQDESRLTIDIVKGKLVVNARQISQVLYLNNKAQGFSQHSVQSSHFVEIKKINAYTQVREKDQYKKIKVYEVKTETQIDSEIFLDDVVTHKFTFPQLREDAISTLIVDYHYKEARFISSFFFQDFHPLLSSKMIIDVDENVEMGFSRFNTENIKIDSTFENIKKRKIYTFEVKNIDKFKDFNMEPPIRYYAPHIIPFVKYYTVDSKKIQVLESPNDLYQWYHQHLNQTCAENSTLKETALKLTQNLSSEADKVKAIYQWVQSNIHYIAIEIGIGGFVPICASEVFNSKYGDCKGMSNIMHEMLKSVGIASHLTWVGTNELPYRYQDVPTPTVDNHMILTYIDTAGIYHYLDATNTYLSYDRPSSFIQGKEAMIDFGDKFEIREIPIVPAEQNLICDTIRLQIKNDQLIGTGNIWFIGYPYEDVRYTTANIFSDEQRVEFLNHHIERGNNKFIVESVKAYLYPEQSKVAFDYKFNIGSYVQNLDHAIYVNLNLFTITITQKIEKERNVPLLMVIHNSYSYHVELEVPEGFVLDYLPPNVDFKNDLYDFTIVYSSKNNKIIYDMHIAYRARLLEPEQFPLENALREAIVKNFKEVVSFKN